jgi:4-amino-4-deoxy-L-arabinose transferase-like glycosyltransferase
MMQAFLVLPGFAAAYLIAGHRPIRRRFLDILAGAAAVVVSGGWYLLLVELWPASSRPYIGGSQHDSIVELALGYNGFGRLTGDEPGGLGNLNFDVGLGRLFGNGMGSDIAWLLPAAVICVVAGFVLTRRAPRTDPTRAARQADPLLHPRKNGHRTLGSRSHRQPRGRRHRRLGANSLHPSDRRPRDHLRPHPAAPKHIART